MNPEETGALLVLGEVALLRGDTKLADERLAAACRTNPKAVGGFFLRGYLAWKRGDDAGAMKTLEETRTALGQEWQPKGATIEGDVKQKQHVEKTRSPSSGRAGMGMLNQLEVLALSTFTFGLAELARLFACGQMRGAPQPFQ